jgi:hypothetical protein
MPACRPTRHPPWGRQKWQSEAFSKTRQALENGPEKGGEGGEEGLLNFPRAVSPSGSLPFYHLYLLFRLQLAAATISSAVNTPSKWIRYHS